MKKENIPLQQKIAVFLVILIEICYFPSSIYALKCFICNSTNETMCNESQMSNRTKEMEDKLMIACPENTQFCRKTIQMIFQNNELKETRYIRDCALNWSMPAYPKDPQILSSLDTSNIYYGDDLKNLTKPLFPNSMAMPTRPSISQANNPQSPSTLAPGLPTIPSKILDDGSNKSSIKYSYMCERNQANKDDISDICYCSGPDGCNGNIILVYSDTGHNQQTSGNETSSTPQQNNASEAISTETKQPETQQVKSAQGASGAPTKFSGPHYLITFVILTTALLFV